MNRTMSLLLGLFALFIPVLVFAPSFHGAGLWDDQYFIFDRYAAETFTYAHFWKHALWPFFESTTLTLYNLFGTQTLYWHLTNFTLHLINGLILGKVVKHFRPSLATPIMLLFWVHPLCALTVGWMVQLKTLMSFFFSFAALLILLRFKSSKKTLAISSLFFFFSVTSKSAAVVLPFVALAFILLRKPWRSHALKLTPFIVISLMSLVRMSVHDDLQLTIKNSEATITTLVETPTTPEVSTTEVDSPIEQTPAEGAPAEVAVVEEAIPTEVAVAEEAQTQAPPLQLPVETAGAVLELPPLDEAELSSQIESYSAPTKIKIIAYTSSYYLAAPWLPYGLSPIHSNYRGGFGFKNYFGVLLVLLCLGLLVRKKFWPAILLVAQIVVLAPFLGFIAAPYMTFSIVSEQHLYLALPFAILLQLMLIEALFKTHAKKAYVALFLGLSAMTASYTPTFRNEENFYQRVLSVYPYDRLSALNLANHYFKSGRVKQAVFVLNKALQQAEENPYLKDDIMHPYIQKSHEQMSLLDAL